MACRVDIAERAARDLERIYLSIDADSSAQTRIWFNELERTVLSLDDNPARGALIPEGGRLRQLFYGRNRHRCRVVYDTDQTDRVVTVLHIRHGSRDAFRNDNPGIKP